MRTKKENEKRYSWKSKNLSLNFDELIEDGKNKDTLKILSLANGFNNRKVKTLLEKADQETSKDVFMNIFLQAGITNIDGKKGIADFYNKIYEQITVFIKSKSDQLSENEIKDLKEFIKIVKKKYSKYIIKPNFTFIQIKGIQAKALYEYFRQLDKDISIMRFYRLIAEIIYLFENYHIPIKSDKMTENKLKKLAKKLQCEYKLNPIKPYKSLDSKTLDKLQKDIKNHIEQLPLSA